MHKLTEEFNKVTVNKGDVFYIALASNPSTGYTWEVKLKSGKASIVKEAFLSAVSRDSEVVGAGGTEVFIFQAEEAGTIRIKADYKQPWKGGNFGRSHTFDITVK
jgi:inhibitor of cysteine peptidase